MSNEAMMLTTIPFCGFYESHYSSEVDHIERNEAEYFEEYRQDEDGIAKELQIDADTYEQILFDCTDYGAAYLDIAKDYADTFNEYLSDEVGFKLGMTFESMSSPREYNFTTDRIFCHIPQSAVEQLFKLSEGDNHIRLRLLITERFTSRSGFSSYYSNDLDDWLEKPLEDWDHNEVCALLQVFLTDDDWEMNVYYRAVDGDGCYSAWSNAVDWDKVESKLQEARDELAEELRADDPDYVPPPVRCHLTIDMFTGREG